MKSSKKIINAVNKWCESRFDNNMHQLTVVNTVDDESQLIITLSNNNTFTFNQCGNCRYDIKHNDDVIATNVYVNDIPYVLM